MCISRADEATVNASWIFGIFLLLSVTEVPYRTEEILSPKLPFRPFLAFLKAEIPWQSLGGKKGRSFSEQLRLIIGHLNPIPTWKK